MFKCVFSRKKEKCLNISKLDSHSATHSLQNFQNEKVKLNLKDKVTKKQYFVLSELRSPFIVRFVEPFKNILIFYEKTMAKLPKDMYLGRNLEFC